MHRRASWIFRMTDIIAFGIHRIVKYSTGICFTAKQAEKVVDMPTIHPGQTSRSMQYCEG